MEELRLVIPQQCDIKGDCEIGILRSKHIFIRLSQHEDFINTISKGAFYINCKNGYSYYMCRLIYDARFRINKETTKTMACISFSYLLVTYFSKECFFLAYGIEKPLQLDLATINRTRPSCARVKVLIDLKGVLPRSVIMDIKNESTGELRSKIIDIRYDYVPKYCEECKMQEYGVDKCKGHSREKRRDKVEVIEEMSTEKLEKTSAMNAPKPWVPSFKKGEARILSSGKVVGDPDLWSVVKDIYHRTQKRVNHIAHPLKENGFDVLGEVIGEDVIKFSSTTVKSRDISSSTKIMQRLRIMMKILIQMHQINQKIKSESQLRIQSTFFCQQHENIAKATKISINFVTEQQNSDK